MIEEQKEQKETRGEKETGRLEAFSDGVLAIIITIMVLEIKVPLGDKISNLKPLLPVFLCSIFILRKQILLLIV